MSLPPPPPPGPPPSGPPPGPPPGWGPPGYPPFGPPPRRRRVGLVVGTVLLAVVLLAAVGVGAFLIAGGGDDDGDRTADDRSTAASGSPSGSTATGTPSATGSPHGSTVPTDAPSSGPSTPYTPSDDTDDDIHNDVRTADFPGDWDFRLGDVEHHATLVRSVDHASCAPVEERNVLTRQRCQYAAQWVFKAVRGQVRLTHLFLVFDTERHAKAAQAAMKDQDFDLPADSTLPSFAQGRWSSGVYGNIVAVTIGTARAGVSEKRLTSLVDTMNSDYRSALLFGS